jgi:translation initiation factor IF-1
VSGFSRTTRVRLKADTTGATARLKAGTTGGDGTMVENDAREEGRRVIAVEGVVREALPYAQYRVEIDGQRQIVAHAPGGAGRNFIRVLIGDRVRLELSPRDVTRGRIVQKIG